MRGREEAPTLITNFAVKRSSATESGYTVRRFARMGIRQTNEDSNFRRRANTRIARKEMEKALTMFHQDAQESGLEIGQHDPAVKLLRLTSVGFGPSAKEPDVHPGQALMRIDDGQGNVVQFRMVNQPHFVDGQEREWNRVVARIEYAKIHGKKVYLTHEMTRNGFVFLSHGMPELLDEVKKGKQPAVTIRQETPDAICFVDGHHTFAGRHDLGCYCKEEREASLATIHDRWGINSLMPGTGNGNGSEAQDIQTAVRYSAARRGVEIMPPYPEVYNRMDLKGDDRNAMLKISTLLLEHLFQLKNVPNITTLTESRTKQNIWHTFGAIHTVQGESLNVTPADHPDSRYKQQAYGYTRADQTPFPLQQRRHQ